MLCSTYRMSYLRVFSLISLLFMDRLWRLISRYSSTSSLRNAILTPFISELNPLNFILNCRTTINNDFRKSSSPKGSGRVLLAAEGTFGGGNLRGPNIQPIATTRSNEIALLHIPT
jgi:hypothetical protein